MLTLKLIFYGLVALVPSINGEGAMVVFPTGKDVLDANGCAIPLHAPKVFQVTADEGGEAGLEEIFPKTPSYIEPEDLMVNGFSSSIQGVRLTTNNGLLIFPPDSTQSRDTSWIPKVARFSGGNEDIRSECLVHPTQCNIGLMVRTWQGNLHTCHLSHQGSPAKLIGGKYVCGKDGPILAYRFKELGATSAAQDVVQAVADAFMIELSYAGKSSVSLYIEGDEKEHFPIEFGDETSITLIFANLPTEPMRHSGRCEGLGVDRHFSAYYDLGALGLNHETPAPIPQATFEESPLIAMDCETEISLLDGWIVDDYREKAKKAGVKHADRRCRHFIKPHSLEVCSTAAFFPAVLPSLRAPTPNATSTSVKALVGEPEIKPRRVAPRRVQGTSTLRPPGAPAGSPASATESQAGSSPPG